MTTGRETGHTRGRDGNKLCYNPSSQQSGSDMKDCLACLSVLLSGCAIAANHFTVLTVYQYMFHKPFGQVEREQWLPRPSTIAWIPE